MNKFPFVPSDSIHVTQEPDLVYIHKDHSRFGYMLNENIITGLKAFIASHPEENIEIGKDYIKIKRAKWL